MRYSIVTLIAGVLTSAFAMAASTPSDQLYATKHNFTVGTYAATLGQGTMCQPCHTPHHALTISAVSTRLWNHALSGATYTLYEGDQRAAVGAVDSSGNPLPFPADDSQGMDRVSRLCLGCHDGTVALDSYGMGPDGSAAGHVGTQKFAANNVNNLGTDFTDDHPVGVDAVALTISGGIPGDPANYHLKAASLTTDTNGVVTKASIGGLGLASIQSTGWVVGCRTCHNPHGTAAVAGTPGVPNAFLLNVPAKDLCNKCHYK